MEYLAGKYGVIVVGAGHAGCEAALAAARMGCLTVLVTLNLDSVAHMPCNPSVGGPGKGHLVREIDALGGQMGITADETSLQARMLNTGKGPAVQALRVQSDKKAYQRNMLNVLMHQEKLSLVQGVVEKVLVRGERVVGVVTRTGARFEATSVVLTSGTYLRGRIIIGPAMYAGGPNGQMPSLGLSESLKELGVELGRFKTGTPPRIQRGSVDFGKFLRQGGDDKAWRFSFMPTVSEFWRGDPAKQEACWLGYTTEKTHEIIRANLDRAPLFSGEIEGIGPRYCPSIEDKVVRFAERNAHQIFLEPEGSRAEEYYIAGLSTSMPEDVQVQILRSIPGLERVKMLRPGYAIEYDYVKPHQLSLGLEVRSITGLFTAGQLNGTSGYEEAAAQGLLAGINAAMKVLGREEFVVKRSEGYIGVLADDLVTKGVVEPYRVLTSRAEYRLVLRQDNADLRLTERGRAVGLVGEERWRRFQEKVEALEHVRDIWRGTTFGPGSDAVAGVLARSGSSALKSGIKAEDLIRRPEIGVKEILELMPDLGTVEAEVLAEAEVETKYAGYIEKQVLEIGRFLRMEERALPVNLDFADIRGLSVEGRERLSQTQPRNLGQASRITGVTPADVSVLMVYLEQVRRGGGKFVE
ncbi:tRNA uridine 5-carboxymethylaminomethyl modification enzyme GidA [Acididesulfobacillus acetoxydans]|uniref:tRNA uridine 5-carboxymethylaminomethyl modification enzyme MnmG n=1 Tax=Acididesulfobacillus acetoxydans TaxID=1561005 RepID=A0A8S0XAH6_9FIRM|nr:tRNA uridine-5-carboxymethylaminomethyl(34) synthesis enzyme MnmG [Acididesulfobacillus acetoxydans]CAA7599816.1 tRNA uridine 5-carboxymethylaminomethyl modification enzyme GidA [Acididesulfobacillus acetoxydans]CEJ07382.1 tRNA uridine 5-carboxymethylaminomethyl modification enzyme MnmG [Acididesulfobacillus acetoxydans]